MTTGIPATRYADRIARAAAAIGESGLRGLLIGVGPELEWLTGYDAKALERLTLLVLPADGDASIVVPRLEVAAAEAAPRSGRAPCVSGPGRRRRTHTSRSGRRC
ncbi:MAG: aminopeptidase P family N-terminal domain-containing protein [Chloroflexota bacterium]